MTKFVVYNVATAKVHDYYPSESTAKRIVTKQNKKGELQVDGTPKVYAYADLDTYNNTINIEVETHNMLTGKKLMIRKSDLGTCCDPATETYHSM